MNTKRILSITATLLMATEVALAEKKEVCRALAMSGGANKGAYEVGVVKGLVNLLPAEDVQWDVVTGVSAGAINSAGMSIFPVGKEKEMVVFLDTLLQNIHSEYIYDYWDGLITDGILKHSGFFNDTPLQNFLTDVLSTPIEYEGAKRKVVVAAVDTNTGNYVTFTDEGTHELFATKVRSSASIPFIFPHVELNDMVLMDGGTVFNTNIVSAVEKCKEMVEDDSQVTLDIVICSSASLNKTTKVGHTIDNYMRYRDVSSYFASLRDVNEFKLSRPKVNYRYFFMPTEPLTSGFDEMIFENSTMFPMMQVGERDAKRMIEAGEGKGFELLEQWHKDPSLKKEHRKFERFLRSSL